MLGLIFRSFGAFNFRGVHPVGVVLIHVGVLFEVVIVVCKQLLLQISPNGLLLVVRGVGKL